MITNWTQGIFTWIAARYIAGCTWRNVDVAIILNPLRAIANPSDRISWIVREPWFKECLTAFFRFVIKTINALTYYAFRVIIRTAASLVANWTASIVFSKSFSITAAMIRIFGWVALAVRVGSPVVVWTAINCRVALAVRWVSPPIVPFTTT